MASVSFDRLDGYIWMNGEFVKWAPYSKVSVPMAARFSS
jgi:hypothetical protein